MCTRNPWTICEADSPGFSLVCAIIHRGSLSIPVPFRGTFPIVNSRDSRSQSPRNGLRFAQNVALIVSQPLRYRYYDCKYFYSSVRRSCDHGPSRLLLNCEKGENSIYLSRVTFMSFRVAHILRAVHDGSLKRVPLALYREQLFATLRVVGRQ